MGRNTSAEDLPSSKWERVAEQPREICEQWLDFLVTSKGLGENSLRAYSSDLCSLCLFAQDLASREDLSLEQIFSPRMLRTWLGDLVERGFLDPVLDVKRQRSAPSVLGQARGGTSPLTRQMLS